MDIPKVRDMVSWKDKRLNRTRFGTVVEVNTEKIRVRAGDGKVHEMRTADVKAF